MRLCLAYAGWIRTSDFSGTVLRQKKTLKFFLKVGSGKVDITGGLAWCVFAWPTLAGFGRPISRAPFYDEKKL